MLVKVQITDPVKSPKRISEGETLRKKGPMQLRKETAEPCEEPRDRGHQQKGSGKEGSQKARKGTAENALANQKADSPKKLSRQPEQPEAEKYR